MNINILIPDVLDQFGEIGKITVTDNEGKDDTHYIVVPGIEKCLNDRDKILELLKHNGLDLTILEYIVDHIYKA